MGNSEKLTARKIKFANPVSWRNHSSLFPICIEIHFFESFNE
jgi:hypothetical protein